MNEWKNKLTRGEELTKSTERHKRNEEKVSVRKISSGTKLIRPTSMKRTPLSYLIKQ